MFKPELQADPIQGAETRPSRGVVAKVTPSQKGRLPLPPPPGGPVSARIESLYRRELQSVQPSKTAATLSGNCVHKTRKSPAGCPLPGGAIALTKKIGVR